MKTSILATSAIILAVSSSTSTVDAFGVRLSAGVSTTKLGYATEVPELAPQHKRQVQRRFRKLLNHPKTQKKTTKTSRHGAQEAVEVLTMKEFQKEVLDEKEKLVIVRFFAPWCRTCHAIAPYYSKFAKETTNDVHGDHVKFVDCPLTANSGEIHQTLGVNTIPFAHIYHPEAGLVEERRLAKKHYMGFERTAKTYMVGECELKDGDASIDPSPNVLRVAKEEAAALA